MTIGSKVRVIAHDDPYHDQVGIIRKIEGSGLRMYTLELESGSTAVYYANEVSRMEAQRAAVV